MKIRLIAPARKTEWGEDFWSLRTFARLTRKRAGGAPLALPTIAALTPTDVEISITDENVEPVDFDEPVDLVGITSITALAPRAYEIADGFRERGVKVVLGGIHASMMPDEAAQHADAVVIGEAEEMWQEVVEDFRAGRHRKFYRSHGYPALSESPVPRWDLLKSDQYCYFTVQVGRGCPYDCDFCSVRLFNGSKYRHKSVEMVERELATLQKIDRHKLIFFVDDNILALPRKAEGIFRRLIPLKVSWWCQASVNRLKNDQLLDLMRESGCRAIFVGFESLCPKTLDSMSKSRLNKVEEYHEIVEKVHSHGIAIIGSFIVGSDADDEDVFGAITQFIAKSNIAFSMVNILCPLPGTSIFRMLETKARLLHKNWEQYDGERVCFKPTSCLPKELQANHDDVLRQIYSYGALYSRLRSLWTMGVLLRDNRNKASRLLTKGRFFFTLQSLKSLDLRRIIFAMKGLWHPRCTSITNSVLLGLNFHDYAANLHDRSK